MDDVIRDLRFAVRGLARTPGFTFAAVVTLALGIGANTAIFSVVDHVLLRPLAYERSERLVAVFEHDVHHGAGRNPTSPANFFDWRDGSATLRDLTAAHPISPVLRGEGRPEQLAGLKATPTLFRLLGVEPLLGRTFDPEDDRIVVLGHELWQRRFGGDRAVVGRVLDLDGEPYEVVGVMPPGFRFPPFWATEAEMWVPLVFGPDDAGRRGARFLRVFGRLAPEADVAAAQAEMTALGERLAADHPGDNQGIGVRVEPLIEPVVSDSRTALLVFLATVGFVLAIACANVANLVLARAASRHREIALRAALGAGRGRLTRLLLAESLTLASAGGAAGLAVGAGILRAVVGAGPPDLPRLAEIALDARVFLFTLAVAVLTGLLFGLAPLANALRLDLAGTLKPGVRGAAGGGGRLRHALVVVEIALALALLVGAGLLSRSLARLWRLDPGFETAQVLTLDVSVAGTEHAAPEAQNPFFDELVATAAATPGVESAAAVNHLPIGGDLWSMGYFPEGRPAASREELIGASLRVVTPGYFETLGVPLLAGRDFDGRDREDAPPVVVINRRMAELLWPGSSAVGRRLHRGLPGGDRWVTVVGVVGDVRQWDLADDVRAEVYFPYRQNPVSFFEQTTIVARTRLDPETLASPLRDRVFSLAPDVAVTKVRTMEGILSTSLRTRRFHTALLAGFAMLAMALAAVGIYGVVSYAVGQRRREIGIRMALGARRREVLRLVLGHGLRLASAGLVVGLAGSVLLVRGVESLLFDVGIFDPTTFAVVALFLLATSLAAAWLPARRATGIEPAVCLREE